MRGTVIVRLTLACALTATALSACSPVRAADPAPADPAPAARPVEPDLRVGAVFLGGEALHACSASVLASQTGDLILTAAHCLADGVDAWFVPGLGGPLAKGAGRIDAVYLDPRWMRNQDPLADYAIARVRFDDGGNLEEDAGGGLLLGSAPASGTEVTVAGYPAGVGGGPASCTGSTVSGPQGFPALPCKGVVGGFSGAPWMTGSTVSGVVGGLDGGGCADEMSYSAPFDDAVAALLARAEAGGEGDEPPTVFDDGCD